MPLARAQVPDTVEHLGVLYAELSAEYRVRKGTGNIALA
jgi:hypothetical protein